MNNSVNPTARKLIEQLRSVNQRIALAESCTCGMAASLIGGVAGASQAFCGSLVTYRAETKQCWLGVKSSTIEQHTAESRQTTRAMAVRLIDATPEADWAAAITGHLGPDAPTAKDGLVFVALASSAKEAKDGSSPVVQAESQFRLVQTDRIDRQIEASERLLGWVIDQIS